MSLSFVRKNHILISVVTAYLSNVSNPSLQISYSHLHHEVAMCSHCPVRDTTHQI